MTTITEVREKLKEADEQLGEVVTLLDDLEVSRDQSARDAVERTAALANEMATKCKSIAGALHDTLPPFGGQPS